MNATLSSFLSQLSDPRLCTVVVLTLAVILVNGWTDAPNAIATAVATGAMPFRRAARLAAVCNLLGMVSMTALSSSVAETIYTIADFGPDSSAALTALCAALCAIVLWATAAWAFGIPTSESHALVAGVSGAAVALQGGFSNLRWEAWGKVLWGLVLSVGLGYLFGVWCLRVLCRAFSRVSPGRFRRLQTGGAAIMAFFHGAQDGQKFLGVFLLGVALARGWGDGETFHIPLWLTVLCALVMALGTALGGRRIIDTVGRNMVSLDSRQGFAADLAGGLCLLLSTLLGLPVSTTHTKTAAIWGAGSEGRTVQVNTGVAQAIALTWLCTFPGCGLIGYGMAKLFLFLFF